MVGRHEHPLVANVRRLDAPNGQLRRQCSLCLRDILRFDGAQPHSYDTMGQCEVQARYGCGEQLRIRCAVYAISERVEHCVVPPLVPGQGSLEESGQLIRRHKLHGSGGRGRKQRWRELVRQAQELGRAKLVKANDSSIGGALDQMLIDKSTQREGHLRIILAKNLR
jgi:hypothetical protein